MLPLPVSRGDILTTTTEVVNASHRIGREPRRVSFAREVAVIESAPLCSTDKKTDYVIDPAAPSDQCLIVSPVGLSLFPGEDPMD